MVSITLLAVLMLATSGRKPIRKMLLGLPIGMFLHLVFDGAWTDTDTFWWPLTGWEFDGDPGLPVLERSVWSIGMEAVGVAGCVWLWRIEGFADAKRRRRFLRDGHLVALTRGFG